MAARPSLMKIWKFKLMEAIRLKINLKTNLKKSFIKFLMFSLVLAAAAFHSAVYCSAAPAAAGVENGIVKNVGKLRIAVDERIELLSVIRLLSGYFERGHDAFATDYKKAALDYFKKYEKHPAVDFYKKMADAGFTFDAPPSAMLHLSWPEMKVKTPFSEYLVARARGVENLNKMAELFADFAKKSDFDSFFKKNAPFYAVLVSNAVKSIGSNDFVAHIEEYYGLQQNGYNVVLAPILRRQGGYGPSIKAADGRLEVFNVMGPVSADGGNYDFGGVENFRSLVWHEFGHSFVNPLTELHSSEVALYEKLFAPIAKKMAQQAYPQWQTCVNEHIIRAVCARLTALYIGAEECAAEISYERSCGFAYIEDLCGLLKEYEEQRRLYPEFKAFYPRIIELFKKLAESGPGEDYFKIKFAGPINSAFDMNPASFVFVVPGGEKDAAAQEKIVKCALGVRENFFKGARLMKDSDALKLDASKHSFIAYGTAGGNALIKKYLEMMPVKFGSGEIELGEKYYGKNLRFITCWPNPADGTRAIVIYTAIDASDVVGLNSIFHGPTDYVVADGRKTLKASNYKKSGGEWKAK